MFLRTVSGDLLNSSLIRDIHREIDYSFDKEVYDIVAYSDDKNTWTLQKGLNPEHTKQKLDYYEKLLNNREST